MKTWPSIKKFPLTILSILILTACSGGDSANSQVSGSNWGQMVWDQGHWQ